MALLFFSLRKDMTFNQSYKYKYKQGNIYQSMFLWPELYIRNVKSLSISYGKKNTIASSLLGHVKTCN